jgi:MoaA/NifB/PqqE/SkfB family radical SAM enzyme
MKQEAPFCIQVELTEGCNLFCSFCGIRGIRRKPGDYRFLSLKNARSIAKSIASTGWNSRIEFAMHGEPTRNPLFMKIIKAFRNALPNNQLAILTNGVGLVKNPRQIVSQLFQNGLNIIAIDDYKTNPFSEKIKKRVDGYWYPDVDMSPHAKYKINETAVIYIRDITTAKSGGHSTINSHCGCATPPPLAYLPKRCAKPFRELSIRYDGHIAICCNDWRGHYVCGNALDKPLIVIWNNERFRAVRKMLYWHNRNFVPCMWCDAISYRVGLLPDKMGKKELAKPNSKDLKIIDRNPHKNHPLAPVVQRKWELRKRPTIRSFLK